MINNENFRVEHDLLGERNVANDKYYGIHTLRALENFHITGISIHTYPGLINALAFVKEASARANFELGLQSKNRTDAIIKACQEIREGKQIGRAHV